MRFRLLSLIASLAPCVLADVEFITPAPGKGYPAGALSVSWQDSGSGTPLSELTNPVIYLMAGGNDDSSAIPVIDPVTPGTFQGGTSTILQVAASKGASTKNAYYLKIVSAGAAGKQVINYSQRFSLTGMTGSFPPGVADAVSKVSGSTDVPDTQESDGNSAAAAIPTGSVTLYMEQTGPIKYAPMQKQPPTKISAPKVPTPQNPTSAFAIAKTRLPIPTNPTSTATVSNTFSVQSIENTAAPAPMPSDDMAKFLARWKD
ncbi:MAG: hypothetical protein M1820_007273 [Bogoriella megaspora]|nr:MAG: hypothetical protein M1820_007273 [Bogoriella megaspora]